MTELDSAIDNYQETGPLGSTDRRVPIDIEALFAELQDAQSSIAESWAEYQMKEWVKTLGVHFADMTLPHLGHLFYCGVNIWKVPN